MTRIKWRLIIYSLVLCGLLLLVSGLHAQPQPGAEKPSPEVQAKAAELERQYEVIIRNALSDYFPTPTFIVDTRIQMSKVRYPKKLKRQKTLNRPLSIQRLPGLPILPEGFTKSLNQGDTLKPSEVEIGYQIENITATVMVDTSYSSDDVEFVKQLVRSEASLDQMRGDRVIVEETVFPRSVSDLAKAKKKRKTRKKADSAAAASGPADGSIKAMAQQYLPYILIGLAVLMLAGLGILYWINRRNRQSLREQIPSSDELVANMRSEMRQLQEEEPEDGEPTEEEKEQLQRDQTYVTTQFISHPDKVGKLLEKWIQEDEGDGVWKSAKAIKASNSKLLSTLKPVMKKKHYQSLQHSIDDMEPLTFQEKKEQTKEFRNALEKELIEESEEKSGDKQLLEDLFNFLKQLTDQQLLHLLRDQTDNVVAIALAQLDSERSARLLKQMDNDRQTKVLIEMGNLSDQPIETYKQVARHLSNKAVDVYNMRHVPANGVKSILSVIDRMSVDEQEEYVNKIAENDIELANKIRRYFVAFSDIPEVDDQLLQSALDELETDTIITALTGADDAIYDKILRFRPEREQELIKSELQTGREVNKQQIERARKAILQEIRKQKSA